MERKDIIIVIGRQFGSGGRALGQVLARRFGIAYYDKEMIDAAAADYGFDASILAKADEKRPSLFRTIVECVYGNASPSCDLSLSSDKLYELQSRAIADLAQKGGAVFVGRTADYVLRHHPGLVSIFVHADVEVRAHRIVRRGDCATVEQARELARKRDKLREEYYNYFSGRKWGSAGNYHLCVDVSEISIEDAADIVTAYVNARFGKTN